jgi:hypothetical protein
MRSTRAPSAPGCSATNTTERRDSTIVLFVDNASIHKSKLTLRWLANHPCLKVCYLPAYSGHQTNPVEKV